MTREEAQDRWIKSNNSFDTLTLVNDIYDDFESRTCENCKHYSSGYCPANVFYIYNELIDKDEEIHLQCNKDFGCNKFEKDNQ